MKRLPLLGLFFKISYLRCSSLHFFNQQDAEPSAGGGFPPRRRGLVGLLLCLKYCCCMDFCCPPVLIPITTHYISLGNKGCCGHFHLFMAKRSVTLDK